MHQEKRQKYLKIKSANVCTKHIGFSQSCLVGEASATEFNTSFTKFCDYFTHMNFVFRASSKLS